MNPDPSQAKFLCHLGGTMLATIPDQTVIPGGQWIAVENTPAGRGLALIISDDDQTFITGKWIVVPHTAASGRMLDDLITACQKIQAAAPVPAQRPLFDGPAGGG